MRVGSLLCLHGCMCRVMLMPLYALVFMASLRACAGTCERRKGVSEFSNSVVCNACAATSELLDRGE